MKIITLIIIIFPFILFGQVKKTYPNGKTKITFDTINQMIDGDFKYFYENGNIKAKGQFSKNQKTGVWKFFSLNGKLLSKRNYTNNYDFQTKENIPTLNLNNYNYWHINDYDILYQDDFLTLISENKANEGFFKNNLLLSEIKKYILSKNSEVYNDEEFSRIINLKDSISSIDNIKHFVFKETVFYDSKYQIINRRVLAIMPAEIKNNKIIPLFSIYEPYFREFSESDIILNKLYYNQYFGEVIKLYNKDSSFSNFQKMSPNFANDNISWFDIRQPFDLEAFYLEKEVNNNLRMKIEPELYINSNDSLIISKKRKPELKYKLQKK